MYQPKPQPGSSVKAYQDALDNIPWLVKIQNPAYRWSPTEMGEFSMSWKPLGSSSQDGSGDPAGFDKELLPGTKEPYYLEGPDMTDPQKPDFGWLGPSPLDFSERSQSIRPGSRPNWKRSEEGKGPEQSSKEEGATHV
ncbi:hypothetical protein TWF730_001901 [Orbilia blumenaviensis]|uniref:Uncharacterized protein n=1 Tax=Orbilia blumenaviensis TaxID=1796055 RepID=A0AAV9UCD0_9PEZI